MYHFAGQRDTRDLSSRQMSRRKPHFYFQNLLEIMDTLRRECTQVVKAAGQAEASGLTARQESAVSQVKQMLEEHPEGVSLKELASRTQMTIAAASQLVETLVSKGYLVRTPAPEDRRAVRITLSERGHALFAGVYELFHQKLDERAKALSPEELHALADIVRKMRV